MVASAPCVDPPAVWGVVRSGPQHAVVTATDVRGLASTLGGMVVVGPERLGLDDCPTLGVRVPAGAGDGECLAAAIRELPPPTAMVAWFGDVVPPAAWADALTQLSAQLGACDAALFGTAVTDAVKRVQGGRIRGGVAREGLFRPVPPILVRVAAARRALLTHLERSRDPVAALSASGLAVRVVPVHTPATR